jgi:hypothetical protein
MLQLAGVQMLSQLVFTACQGRAASARLSFEQNMELKITERYIFPHAVFSLSAERWDGATRGQKQGPNCLMYIPNCKAEERGASSIPTYSPKYCGCPTCSEFIIFNSPTHKDFRSPAGFKLKVCTHVTRYRRHRSIMASAVRP